LNLCFDHHDSRAGARENPSQRYTYIHQNNGLTSVWQPGHPTILGLFTHPRVLPTAENRRPRPNIAVPAERSRLR
jgi:hypothetical protein